MNAENSAELNCKKCEKIFKTKPLRLPCKNIICKHHVIINEKGHTGCYFCKNEYGAYFQIHNKDEIQVDRDILKKLSIYNFNQCYKNVSNYCEQYHTLVTDPYFEIFEHYNKMISELEIQQFNMLEEVYSLTKTHFANINEFLYAAEQECLDKSNQVSFTQIFPERTRDYLSKCSEFSVYDHLPKIASTMDEYLNNLVNVNEKELSNLIKIELDEVKNKITKSVLFDIKYFKASHKNLVYVNTDGLIRTLDIDNGVVKDTLNTYLAEMEQQELALTFKFLKTYGTKKIKFFNNNKYFVAFEENNSMTIWDTNKPNNRLKRIKNFPKTGARIDQCKILSNDSLVFIANSFIKVYNLSQNSLRSIPIEYGYSLSVRCVKVSKTDKNIIYLCHGNTVQVWDISSGEMIQNLNEHKEYVSCIAFLTDQTLVSASSQGELILWSLDDSRVLRKSLNKDIVDITKIKIKNYKIVTLSNKNTIKIWNQNLEVLHGFMDIDPNFELCFRLLSNGQLAKSCSTNKIQFWNIETGGLIKEYAGHENSINFLQELDDYRIVSSSKDKTIRVWDLDEDECSKIINLGDVPNNFKIYKINLKN